MIARPALVAAIAGARTVRTKVAAILCAAILGACGSETPDAMLDSAKDYLARGDLDASSIQLKNALQRDGALAEARFLLGSVYLQQGDLAGAIRELRRAAELGQPVEQVAPLLARALVGLGDFDQVISEFEWVILADRSAQASVLTAVGDAYLGKGDADRAATTYQAALEASDSELTARIGLARSKLLAGDWDAAEAAADAVLAIDSSSADAHALRADVLIARGQVSDAIEALDSALDARPQAVAYHFALISLLLREEELDSAEQRLEAMTRIAPKDLSTLYLKAFIDFRRDRLVQARDASAEIVRRAPDNLPAQLLAGSIHLRLSEHAVAQRHFEFVLARVPAQALARRLLAASLLASGDPGKASEVMAPLLDSAVEDPATLTMAGQVMLANGDFDRAAEYFERVVEAAPQDARARTRLGVSRLAGGQTESAFADLEAASRLDERLAQPDVALILASLRGGDHDKALRAYGELERKYPDSPYTHNLKGGVLLAKRNFSGAREAFERALALKPDFVAAAINLARLDLLENRPADARARFERIVASSPGNAHAHVLLAEVLAQTGAPRAEVQALLDRAVEANPTAIGPRLAMVRFYLGHGEPAKAVALAHEAVAANPDNPRALEWLARAQSAAGSHQQAVAALSTLVRTRPSPEVFVALADAQWAAGDKSGAEQAIRRALRMRPDLLEAQRRLVGYLLTAQREGEALSVARGIQSRRPNAAVGFELEGDAHIATGRWDDAVSAFRAALDRGGGAGVAIKLYSAQLRGGMPAEAARTATAWLRAHPDDLAMRGHLAERALAAERFDEAEALYRRMLEIRQDNPLVLNNLAWVAGRLNRPDAIALAERAVALAPDMAALVDTLGMLQVDGGRHEEGLANLRRAVALAPQLATLRLNLAKGYIAANRKEDARRELDEVLSRTLEGSPMHTEANRLRRTL